MNLPKLNHNLSTQPPSQPGSLSSEPESRAAEEADPATLTREQFGEKLTRGACSAMLHLHNRMKAAVNIPAQAYRQNAEASRIVALHGKAPQEITGEQVVQMMLGEILNAQAEIAKSLAIALNELLILRGGEGEISYVPPAVQENTKARVS